MNEFYYALKKHIEDELLEKIIARLNEERDLRYAEKRQSKEDYDNAIFSDGNVDEKRRTYLMNASAYYQMNTVLNILKEEF